MATKDSTKGGEEDVDFQPLKNPKSTTWRQSISYDDYEKLLRGHDPVSMDDRWTVTCDKPDSSTANRGAVHVYFSWNGEEELRAEFSVNPGADSSTSGPYATFDKVSWEADDDAKGHRDEAGAKRDMANVLENVVGIKLKST